ncbi:MAG: hypothetical protein H6707_14820 [Deltaproteobacteria bacterium]|nr:hypothetical protein [Deltaproteobacteria bacterium]
MPRKKVSYRCDVVSETVSIYLRNRREGGFTSREEPFVQCNQRDCQYVDTNTPPCPLTLDIFADELAERAARTQARREEG